MARLAEARARLQLRRTDKGYTAASLNRWLNEVLSDIASRHAWTWKCEDWNGRTVARLSVSSVSCTSGSPFITLGAAASDTLQGKRVLINNRVYRVIDAGASTGTQFLIDQPFIDSTASYTMTVLYDEVALPPGATGVLALGVQASGSLQPYPLKYVPGTEARMLDLATTGQPWCYSQITRPSLPPPLAAPSAAMSVSGSGPGSGLALTYWYSYVDKQTRAESALSPSVAFTTTSGNAVTVTFTPKRGFHTRVYRSTASGGIPFLLTEVLSSVTSTATDSTTDLYLVRPAPTQGSSVMVKLYPVPDTAYQIVGQVIRQVPSLDRDDDIPMWPEEFDNIWLDGAEAKMLEAADEQGRAGKASARFEAGIARMIQRDSPAAGAMVIVSDHARPLGGEPTMWWGALGSGGT